MAHAYKHNDKELSKHRKCWSERSKRQETPPPYDLFMGHSLNDHRKGIYGDIENGGHGIDWKKNVKRKVLG